MIRLDIQQFLESKRDSDTFITEIERAVVEELSEEFPDCGSFPADARLKVVLNKIFNRTKKASFSLLMNVTASSGLQRKGKMSKKTIWISCADFLKDRIMWIWST